MTIHRSAIAFALVAFAIVAFASTLGSAQGEPPSGDRFSIETASYPLFAVEESGITGQLQIVQTVEGGTHLVLTVYRLAAGAPHAGAVYASGAALYVGSCGPDRPVVLVLEPVGRENDPFVSITESSLTFEELTHGDHFVFVFDGRAIDRPTMEGLDVPALACGEVGLGALAGQP